MDRGRSEGGGFLEFGLTLPVSTAFSFSVSLSVCCSLSFSVSPVCFCVSESLFVFVSLCFSVFRFLCLFTSLSPCLAQCHRLSFSVSPSLSPSARLGPSYTCPHLPCQERNFAPFPRSRPVLPLLPARDVRSAPASSTLALPGAAVAAGSCPFRGRGSRRGGSGEELGQESTGCIRAASGPGRAAPPPRGRAGGIV